MLSPVGYPCGVGEGGEDVLLFLNAIGRPA